MITWDGITVEAWAHRVSELKELEPYEFRVLFSRLPDGGPHFPPQPPRTPQESWPAQPTTPEEVRRRTESALHWMAYVVPTMFQRGGVLTIEWVLARLREELLQALYLRSGVNYPNRLKELDSLLPRASLDDFQETYDADLRRPAPSLGRDAPAYGQTPGSPIGAGGWRI